MTKWKIAMLAGTLAMTSPAQAADSGFDRTIGRAAIGIEGILTMPARTLDAVEGRARWAFGSRRRHERAFDGGLRGLVTRIAIEEGVPVRLGHGVVRIESGYRCSAYNRSGASGIMQVLPRTARGVGITGNLRSCATGLRAGMRYLRQAWLRAGGDMCRAATFYNTGIAGSGRCSAYGRHVLKLARV